MNIKKVTIAGGGTLGSQVAWQTAFHGFEVRVYDAFEKGLEACKKFHQGYAKLFIARHFGTEEDAQQALGRITYTTDLAEALNDADLLNESIPENLELKHSFYREAGKAAPEKTIFTTNTSTLIPSEIVEAVDRPQKFLALHFANGIWDANIGEVMKHPTTDEAIYQQVIEFAKAIKMVPIPIHKEQNGYVINTLLMPFVSAAMELYVKGVTDYESVDKTWMIGSGASVGPFGILDIVGLETAYNITKMWGERLNDEGRLAIAKFVKENYIDKGKLGIKTGEGFYKYPNPKFQEPDFLK